MNIFVAGATGAVGRTLIPLLTEHGHSVTGTTTSPAKLDAVHALGAAPVVMDGLDRDAVLAAVAAARPDAIVHQMTALSGPLDFRRFDRSFETTNRLRTEGTDHLLAAARANGVERVIVQSFTGWPYARTGGWVKTEDDPLDPDPPKRMRTTLDALRHLESAVTGSGGVVLRYGGFYGPGTGIARDGDQAQMVRERKFPLVGDGGGMQSLTHVEDAAGAVVVALERWTPGEIYNVVDDDPAPMREWVPALAAALDAPPPRRIPRWVARLMGEHVAVMMTEGRAASNAKVKRSLAWTPRWPTWRDGFPALART